MASTPEPLLNGPPVAPESKKQLRADLILVFITLIWGSTFTVVKGALADTTPFFFLAIRFLLAALIFLVFFYRKIFPLDFLSFRAGVAVGICLFLGFAFQTYGLAYTSASRSAFLTSLLVLWVPFISLFVEKERPSVSQWTAIGVAIAGMWFLNRPEAGQLGRGDWLTIGCAFFLPCRLSF
jgi:drug/metabolite transporter (DMT)-like permease